MNKVQLCGYLGRDFELRYSSTTGNAVGINSLAISKRFKDNSGQEKERTEWIPIKLFGRTAEVANQYFKKDNSNIEKKLDEIIIAIKDLNNSILNLKMNETNEAYNQNIYRGNMYQFTDMLSQTLQEINSKIEDRIIYLKEQQ